MKAWGLVALATLLAQLAAQDAASDLALLRRTGVYNPGFGMPEKPEYAEEASGEWSVLVEGKLLLLDEWRRPRERKTPPRAPEDALGLKYRAGRWWAWQRDKAVLEYLPARSEWVPRLLPRTAFKDVEITFDGRLVLIGTRKHLVEIYQPAAVEPESAVPYPSVEGLPPGRNPEEDPWFFWQMPVVGRVDAYLVIYFPNLGRLFQVNILKTECQEVDVPWTPLTVASAAAELREQGFLAVTERPPFNGVEFIPESSTRLRVAYQLSNARYRKLPPREGELREQLVEARPSTDKGLHWFSLDLRTHARSQVRDEPERQLPLALDSREQWVPVRALLEAGNEDPAPGPHTP